HLVAITRVRTNGEPGTLIAQTHIVVYVFMHANNR
ncbi:MAG: hypothetical protein ACI91J_003726, partial [Yoonia sp.]